MYINITLTWSSFELEKLKITEPIHNLLYLFLFVFMFSQATTFAC